MRRAVRVRLADGEARQLRAWAQGSSTASRRALRSRIVLMAAEGFTNQAIGAALRVHPETAGLWRRRFVSNRLEGIRMDAPRSSPRRRSARLRARLVRETERGAKGVNRRWTARALAKKFRVSHMTVYRAWHAQRFPKAARPAAEPAQTSSPFPEPVEMEGVFLHPPRRAAVFQIAGEPALWNPQRLGPAPELHPTDPEWTGHGLSVLFHQWKRSAAYRAGSVRSVAELLVFLRMVERREPESASFMVLYEGFSGAAERRVVRWARAHPRFRPIRVPAGTSWFTAVERVVRERPSQSSLATPREEVLRPLTESLASYLQTNPSAPAPFVWTSPWVHSEGMGAASGPSRPE